MSEQQPGPVPETARAPEVVNTTALPEVPDSGRIGARVSGNSGTGAGTGAQMPQTMMSIAGLLRIRVLADDAYAQQSQMGVDTAILMLPTDALYEALGAQPPVVPHPEGESETFGEGSV